MGSNKEPRIRGIMGRTGMSYEEAEEAYRQSMRALGAKGGAKSTARPFSDPEKAREASRNFYKSLTPKQRRERAKVASDAAREWRRKEKFKKEVREAAERDGNEHEAR